MHVMLPFMHPPDSIPNEAGRSPVSERSAVPTAQHGTIQPRTMIR